MKKHDLPMPPMEVAGEIVPIELKALLEEEELSEEEEERALEVARQEIRRQQRTEYEALEEAIPDLIRLSATNVEHGPVRNGRSANSSISNLPTKYCWRVADLMRRPSHDSISTTGNRKSAETG